MELRNRKIVESSVPSPTRTRRRRSSTEEEKQELSEATSLRSGSVGSEKKIEKGNEIVKEKKSAFRKGLAWTVHLYTGLGLLINAYSFHNALYGSTPNFTLFAQLNWLAILVDATDGTFARKFDVKNLASGLDGALLDNIIDFQTFSLLPALAVIIFERDLFGLELSYAIASCILISSGYQFCQTTAKTDEAFVGFPSYWNILLFYVHYLKPNKIFAASLFFGCTLLSFIPIHFIYPTKTKAFFKLNIAGAYLWGSMMILPTMFPEAKFSIPCMKVSLLYVSYYFFASFYLDIKRRKQVAHSSTLANGTSCAQ